MLFLKNKNSQNNVSLMTKKKATYQIQLLLSTFKNDQKPLAHKVIAWNLSIMICLMSFLINGNISCWSFALTGQHIRVSGCRFNFFISAPALKCAKGFTLPWIQNVDQWQKHYHPQGILLFPWWGGHHLQLKKIK